MSRSPSVLSVHSTAQQQHPRTGAGKSGNKAGKEAEPKLDDLVLQWASKMAFGLGPEERKGIIERQINHYERLVATGRTNLSEASSSDYIDRAQATTSFLESVAKEDLTQVAKDFFDAADNDKRATFLGPEVELTSVLSSDFSQLFAGEKEVLMSLSEMQLLVEGSAPKDESKPVDFWFAEDLVLFAVRRYQNGVVIQDKITFDLARRAASGKASIVKIVRVVSTPVATD